jgi:hypothetical protein
VRTICACVLIVILAAGVSLASEQVIHVAPGAPAGGDGSAQKPWASVNDAIQAARSLRAAHPQSPITIELAGGSYFLDRSITLSQPDSGTAQAPLIIRSSAAAKAHLIGGQVIADWQPVTDPQVLNRLPQTARNHIKWADGSRLGAASLASMQTAGFTKGDQHMLELFVNDQPMKLAQYPNRGFLPVVGASSTNKDTAFIAPTDRMNTWAQAGDAWVYGYWHHGWADQFLAVERFDPATGTIRVKHKHSYGYDKKGRFIVMNLIEELDEPGEFYVDRSAGRVYFWPPAGNGQVVISTLRDPLIRISGAAFVSLEGLTIEVGQADGVVVDQGTSITIAGCTVRNLSGKGIVITGGSACRVISCDIRHVGSTGLNLTGGDRATLTPANHEAINNDISHFARHCRTYRPAIQLYGVGLRVAHNRMSHGPHSAIHFAGNDHLIERNEIHHMVLETDDSGAIYIGRDWTARGHIVRYNYFHHCGNEFAPKPTQPLPPGIIDSPAQGFGTNLVYLDDTAPGVTVTHNIFEGGHRAVHLGGGRDNLITNNLFVHNKVGVFLDARGMGWAAKHIGPDGDWQMYDKLKRARFDQPPYSTRYPALATMLQDRPHTPLGSRIENNTAVGVPKWLEVRNDATQYVTIKDNDLIPADPSSAAPSPAFYKKMGFDLTTIGLQIDPWRTSLPSRPTNPGGS